MKDIGQRHGSVGLREALPYMRLFKGKTFVVKVGGGLLADPIATRDVLEQVDALRHLGIRVVLVHGGGAQASTLSRSLGSEPRFVAGRRVTDDAALTAAVLTLNGEANTALLAACRALDIPAVGLSGVDSGLVRARRRPRSVHRRCRRATGAAPPSAPTAGCPPASPLPSAARRAPRR